MDKLYCQGCEHLCFIRELKQRKWRLRKRHSKSEFALSQTFSRLFHLVQLVICWQIFLELNSKGPCQSIGNEKESRSLLFTSSTKWEVPRRWRQREGKKTIGLLSKPTTLQVHHAFSLPSLHNYDMKWPNFKFTWEREQQADKFYYFCLNLGAVPYLHLQPKFSSFK